MDENLPANFYLVTLHVYFIGERFFGLLLVYSLHSEEKYLRTGIFCINEAIESPWSTYMLQLWDQYSSTLHLGSTLYNPYLRLISVSSACVMCFRPACETILQKWQKMWWDILQTHWSSTSDAIFTLRQVKQPIIQSLMPHKSAVVRKDRIVLLRIRSALVYLETQLVFRNFPRALLMCIVVALVANLLQSAPSSTSKWTTFPSHQWLVLVTAILEKVNKNLVLTSSTLEEAGDTTVSCQKKLLVQYPIIMSKRGFYEVNFYYEMGPNFPLKWVHLDQFEAAVSEKVIDSCCWESRIFFKHDLQPYDLLSALKQYEFDNRGRGSQTIKVRIASETPLFDLNDSRRFLKTLCLNLQHFSSIWWNCEQTQEFEWGEFRVNGMLVQMSPIVGSSNISLHNEMHSGQLRFRRLDQLLGYIDLLNSGWVPVLSIGVSLQLFIEGACKCGRCGAVFCRHRGVQTYCAIFTLRQVKEPVLRSLKPQKSPAVQKDRSVLLLIR
ncbi:LOW QUALITY PROTEIN: hypothetical protein Cgig2_030863 [Carnegiea gigantea]|uniref:Uncharacterized protein n=1 Tax=Carnegiea gigantea TaxID=171969 RepID=A0A9Q1KHL1_9CARY|nr:LOW QUALITY PROTEIN: hypothetical protein Cgig2_030863 [Carnegiea gigantea]